MMGLTSLRCLLLMLVSFATVATVRVRCQPDSLGFISIGCGLPENTTHVELTTNITYVPDSGFTETGVNRNMSVAYLSSQQGYFRKPYVRTFPDGDRNCYTLRSLTSGNKYLLRALFVYGDYDGLGKPPVFDVYLGVDKWGTVDLEAEEVVVREIIAFSPGDYLQVCLVNKKRGTPVIYNLVLRQLKPSLYPDVNATQSLVFVKRHNMGLSPSDENSIIRYPDDPHDRVWFPYDGSPDCTKLSTASTVRNLNSYDKFEPPSVVMQTAITPINTGRIDYSWQVKPVDGMTSSFVLVVLFLSEFKPLPPNVLREFNVFINGSPFLKSGPFSPDVLYSDVVFGFAPAGLQEYILTLSATQRSTLPPILNALEVYNLVSATQLPTDNIDVSAITTIKARYQVKRNWIGDPCAPKAFAWEGLNCSYAAESPARITSLKLSKSGLSGVIIASFSDLKALQHLDLSQNNLAGSIPDFLENLPSLVSLDLSGNKLNGPVPAGLLKRSQEGSLTLRIGNICTNGSSCEPRKMRNKTAIVASATVAVILVAVAITVAVFLCSKGRLKEGKDSEHGARSLKLDNQNFSKKDLKKITNNFQDKIGEGGFGSVYAGQLDNGTLVAVKMSKSSSQGIEEFIAEAQILIRVHHKNLVSLIGYCRDRTSLALVYELMSGGTLHKCLRGEESSEMPLTWRQRLKIALESAEGLEYLHKLCNPPLIHRDVKSDNILLSTSLEAKIADFGLSKAFDTAKTRVSTKVAGTPGYLDPEYYTSFMLSTKSDVYSFGVVLLELVTGKSPVLQAPENGHIVHWTQQRVARGNIESIADPNMKGQYDVNSLWKVTDVALSCTAQSSSQRPKMTDVVVQLKESLELAVGSPETVHQPYEEVGGQLPRMDYFQGKAGYSNLDRILETQPLGLNAADLVGGPQAR